MRKTIFLLLCVMLFGTSLQLFAAEGEEGGWKTGGLIVIKANSNPWILAEHDVDSVLSGLNAGIEVASTYGPLGVSIGYQFMGVARSISYYSSTPEYILYAPLDHTLTASVLFAWHKGLIRPYLSLGSAITFKTKAIGVRYAGGFKYRVDTLDNIYVGISSQAGIDFYLLDQIGIGLGIDLLVRDVQDIDAKSYQKLLQDATYVSTRLIVNF